MKKLLRQDYSEINCIFVHSALDDLGLDPCSFRIYAHLARRANGKDHAWPGVASMVDTCRMSRQTVVNSIRKLEEFKLVKVIRKQGTPNLYILTAPSTWKRPSNEIEETGGTGAPNRPVPTLDQSISSAQPVPKIDHHPSKISTRRESMEGTPDKKDTAAGRPEDHSDPSRDIETSDGRMPPGGSPALTRKCKNTIWASATGIHPTQNPIKRKAFAIAARLEGCHWDNSKIIYAKHTTRSYAEEALQQGHNQEAILAAYSTALQRCHQLTTDEMDRGQRHRGEKASPALTVWLAKETLNRDGKTVEQRRYEILQKIQTQESEQAITDAEIRKEAARLAPAISAWFAQPHATETDPAASLEKPSEQPARAHA